MPDLYSEIGQNARRTKPSSEFGTPKITPIIFNTNGQTLPSGNTAWAPNDGTNLVNYSITSDFQSQNGDVFKVVQAVQQYCEIYEVGCTSDSNRLTIMCRDSSIPYDAGTTFLNEGSTITTLRTAVRAALGGAEVLVLIGQIGDSDTDG
jgi:hypothetical protein